MTIHLCEQGQSEWFNLRIGRVTASNIHKLIAKTKKGTTAKRETYLWDLVTERITGQAKPHYVSKAMEWGIENEPTARSAYEMRYDVPVETVGFITHDSIQWFGASPDGLIGDDGGLEIKCPDTDTHLQWMHAGIVPEEHLDQVLSNLSCSGRKWWDFMSYDPRLPEHLKEFIIRVFAEEYAEKIQETESQVQEFLREVEQLTNWFRERKYV